MQTNQKIRCAIVGLAQGIEDVYVTLNHPSFELIAVCDINKEPYQWITGKSKIENSSHEYASKVHIQKLVAEVRSHPDVQRVTYYANYDELLARGDLDAVVLALPDALHESFAAKALNLGLKVLCAKPMAGSVEQARRLAQTARQSPGQLMIGFQYRYAPFARAIVDLIARKAIGTPRVMRLDYHRSIFRPVYRQRVISGGPVIVEGCHWMDLFSCFSHGHLLRAAAFGGLDVHQDKQDIEDHGTVILEYDNGIRASHNFTYFRSYAQPMTVEINGDRGRILANKKQVWLDVGGEPQSVPLNSRMQLPHSSHEGYYDLFNIFADVCQHDTIPETNEEAGLENMISVNIAQKALTEGRLVERSEIEQSLVHGTCFTNR